MRLTTRTNLALRTLMVCAANPAQIVRKSDVAEMINASENHLAQVINQLGQTGYLKTQRGRHGGFSLARPAREISVGALFRTFEGEVALVDCLTDKSTCPLRAHCRMTMHLHRAVEAFYTSLDPLMLNELVECNHGLEEVLTLADTLRSKPVPCLAAEAAG